MRTQKATEARMRAVDERYAERLKSRGWTVDPPCAEAPGCENGYHGEPCPYVVPACGQPR